MTGAGSIFLENAKKLGIDISSVDKVIISHDTTTMEEDCLHFLKLTISIVYLNKFAFGNYYSVKEGIEKYIDWTKSYFLRKDLYLLTEM